jgi:endonuclease/exonuclease/phosphatase (EEP) superfamily protein YafD
LRHDKDRCFYFRIAPKPEFNRLTSTIKATRGYLVLVLGKKHLSPDAAQPQNRLRTEFGGLILSIGFLVGLLCLACLISDYWLFDILASFRPQYSLCLLACGLLAICLKRFISASLFFSLALVNSFDFLIYFTAPAPLNAANSYRIVHVNVHTSNTEYEKVCSFLLKENPDIILFNEVSKEWMSRLSEVKKNYQYTLEQPRPDNFGIAFFSKLEFENAGIERLSNLTVPSVAARLKLIDSAGVEKLVSLVGIHTTPPKSKVWHTERDDLIEQAAVRLSRSPAPRIFIGDLNITPWSEKFKWILKTANLRDSSLGTGLNFTFPRKQNAQLIMSLFSIHIDHILVSPEIEVTTYKVGPDLGSDHLPVVVDFRLK